MELVNKKYTVTAQVLTPLSIGQGSEKDWVYGVDFLTQLDQEEQQWLYHLSMEKMIDAGVDLDNLSKLFADGRPKEINTLIGNKLMQVSDLQMRLPISNAQGLTNPIKTFLRNPLTNRPILAGSSLKGAIRSVLFTYLRDTERDNVSVFGRMTDGSDFMRFIRVGDFEFEKTCLVNTKIYNLHREGRDWQGGWKHGGNNTSNTFTPIGFNTIYECLPPSATAEGNVMFADILFAHIANQPLYGKKKSIMSVPDIATKLCDIVNDHTFNYLNKEMDFFTEYWQGDGSSNIRERIEYLQDMIDNCAANECVIKMSAGAGFHSITGDWQFEGYIEDQRHHMDRKRGGELPKSRKIAVSSSKAFSPMGFVKLTFNH